MFSNMFSERRVLTETIKYTENVAFNKKDKFQGNDSYQRVESTAELNCNIIPGWLTGSFNLWHFNTQTTTHSLSMMLTLCSIDQDGVVKAFYCNATLFYHFTAS